MSSICHELVNHYAKNYERELDSLYSIPGVILVDNSFVNGFVRRRLIRDDVHFNLAEAWMMERLFHERQVALAHEDNADGTARYISFPGVVIHEVRRGIERLVQSLEDPHAALTGRWGGAGGEPAVIESRLDPHTDTDIVDAARHQLREYVKSLQLAHLTYPIIATETFVSPSLRYPQQFETGLGNALGTRGRKKLYHAPYPSHIRPAHYRKERESAGLTSDNSRIIEIKPFQPHPGQPAFPVVDADRQTYLLACAVGRTQRAYILTADNDFKALHLFYKRNRPRADPLSDVTIVLDHGGLPEFVSTQR